MNPIAKTLILIGVLLVLAGLFWQFGGRNLPLGRLPGDIVIEKQSTRIYFPIVTCLVISIVISLVLAILRHLGR